MAGYTEDITANDLHTALECDYSQGLALGRALIEVADRAELDLTFEQKQAAADGQAHWADVAILVKEHANRRGNAGPGFGEVHERTAIERHADALANDGSPEQTIALKALVKAGVLVEQSVNPLKSYPSETDI